MAEPIRSFIITAHARDEMRRRGIDEATVRHVLAEPDERFTVRHGRHLLQSRAILRGKQYLVRVFVDADRQPVEVVTVYITSRVRKYWRVEP